MIGREEPAGVKFYWDDVKKRGWLSTTDSQSTENLVLVEC